MAKFSEAQLEQAIVELFQENGFDYVNGDMLHRKFDEVFLEDDMKSFLSRRYPDITKTELEKIINKIMFITNFDENIIESFFFIGYTYVFEGLHIISEIF